VRIWVYFFKIHRCSAISFKRSRRELSIDVAEHRSILKNIKAVRIFFSKVDLCSECNSKGLSEKFSLISLLMDLSSKMLFPHSNFIPKTGIGLPKTGVTFYCVAMLIFAGCFSRYGSLSNCDKSIHLRGRTHPSVSYQRRVGNMRGWVG